MIILTPQQHYSFLGRDDSPTDAAVVRETWVENVYQIQRGDFYDSGVFVDIGANIGAVSVYAASLNDQDSELPPVKVIAVEPEPHNRNLLTQNLVRNNVFDQVRVYTSMICGPVFPVGAKSWISDEHGDSKEMAYGQGTEVYVASLGRLFEIAQVSEVDVLKIDVEGAEYQILQDIDALQRVKYLTMEFDAVARQPEFHPFGELVADLAHWGSLQIVGSPERGGYIYGRRY